MLGIDFPSGPWTGFYHYGAGTRRHRMDLSLTFSNGQMTAELSISNHPRWVVVHIPVS